ncbi:hypothetical protein GCM10027568_24960 [Humibacter soli]
MTDGGTLTLKHSDKTFDEVLTALRAAVERRGITVMAEIDHAAAARDVGQQLAEETVVIFGNPAVGTAIMTADPRAGLDLPLRVLVREQQVGAELVYRDPRSLADEFDVGAAIDTLETLAHVLDAIASDAIA